jgi:hypothetical protein
MTRVGRRSTRHAIALCAALAAGAALAACSSTEAGPGASALDPQPEAPAPGAPETLVLPDGDAVYLANVALETWALSRSAVGYQLDGCSRIDPATADCASFIEFADNPANPQTCSLAITVAAAAPTVGIKEPTPADPSLRPEIEEYAMPSGGYGTYRYGDETACEDAQYRSGL